MCGPPTAPNPQRDNAAKNCFIRIDGPDGKQIELANGATIDTVILATGYTYDFPFLDAPALGMSFSGQRHVTPLYQHLLHASIPTLGFVGVPLSIPCPMPYFAAQARYIAACWSDESAAVVLPGEQVRRNFDIVLDRVCLKHLSAWSQLYVAPHPPHDMCSTWSPCLSDADWCAQSCALFDSHVFRTGSPGLRRASSWSGRGRRTCTPWRSAAGRGGTWPSSTG